MNRLLVAVLLATSCRADVIFANLNAAVPVEGLFIFGTNVPDETFQANAASFTPTSNYVVTGAQARFFAVEPNSNSFARFEIFTDANGAPASSIGSLGEIAVTADGIVHAPGPTSSIVLMSGVQYWFVIAPGSSTTHMAWALGGPMQPLESFTNDPDLKRWIIESEPESLQFEVDGTLASTVPEPTNLGLIGLGALVLLGWKRFANRVS